MVLHKNNNKKLQVINNFHKLEEVVELILQKHNLTKISESKMDKN